MSVVQSKIGFNCLFAPRCSVYNSMEQMQNRRLKGQKALERLLFERPLMGIGKWLAQAFNALNPSQTNSRTHPQARQRRAEPGSMRRQQSAQAALQQLRASSPDRQLHPLFQRQGVTGGQAIRPGVARLPQLQEAGRDDMPWPLASLAPDSPSAQPCESPELLARLGKKGRFMSFTDVCDARLAWGQDRDCGRP